MRVLGLASLATRTWNAVWGENISQNGIVLANVFICLFFFHLRVFW
jgi:hypothetical protein